MTTQINGIDYDSETTVLDVVEQLKQKGEFEETAEGFKANIKPKPEPTAEELLNEVGVESPISFFKNTKPLSDYEYFNTEHKIVIRGEE